VLPTGASVLLLTRDDTAVSGERIWIDMCIRSCQLWLAMERRRELEPGGIIHPGSRLAATAGRGGRTSGYSGASTVTWWRRRARRQAAAHPSGPPVPVRVQPEYLSTRTGIIVPENIPFPRDVQKGQQVCFFFPQTILDQG
jgi:hypothetical protein